MTEISTKRPVNPFPFKWMTDVEETPIQWLWAPYIPRSGLTLLIGDGGFGKSTLTCSLAADLSRGRALPGQEAHPPMSILMLSGEDDFEHVIKHKLRLLDADMSRIAGFDEGFKLTPACVKRIIDTMRKVDATVVFLDPLVVYMGGDVDMHKANETRAVIKQLNEVAKETSTAIVIVHHVRKGGAVNLQHKAMGSADLVNSARSTLLVDISKSGQYYMAHVKSNWSKKGPTIAYNFDGESFHWQGEYIGEEADGHEISKTPRHKAKSFIIATLKDGEVPASEIVARAADEGINERTLMRAKKGVARSEQREHQWVWVLEEGAIPVDPALNLVASEALLAQLGQGPRDAN